MKELALWAPTQPSGQVQLIIVGCWTLPMVMRMLVIEQDEDFGNVLVQLCSDYRSTASCPHFSSVLILRVYNGGHRHAGTINAVSVIASTLKAIHEFFVEVCECYPIWE